MSHIPATNAPMKSNVPEGQLQDSNVSKERLKRDRPIGSITKTPQMKKEQQLIMEKLRSQ